VSVNNNAATLTITTTIATPPGTYYFKAEIDGVTSDNEKSLTVTAFVPVTNITGIPETAFAGPPLLLEGTVNPATATNKTIVWSMLNQGTTGATLDGATLNATGTGDVIVKATVAGGLTPTDDYEKTFTIELTSPFASGDGTSGNPYRVANAGQLNAVRYYLTSYFVQTADITLSGNWTPVGTNANRFTGTYDSDGFSINDLNISATADFQGLFGYIGTGGAVKNLALRSVNINSTGGFVGGIAGYNTGTIENSYVSGTVSGSVNTGGIAGINSSVIQSCYTTCNVTGSTNTGGIAGENRIGSKVQYCYATGTVTGTDFAGGIAGNNGSGSSVNHCVALNREVVATSATGAAGRIVGFNIPGGTLAENYTCLMGLQNGSGIVSPIDNVSGIHGSSVGSEQYLDASVSFWTSTVGFDFYSYWDIENGRLPWLLTTFNMEFSEEQNPEVQ